MFDTGPVTDDLPIAAFDGRRPASALQRSADRLLPVGGALGELVPGGGLAPGWVVEVGGPAGPSLALTLVSGVSQAGSWIAGLGLTGLGLVAAAELGVDLERLVLVDGPEPTRWSTVAATLVEAFDVVVARPGHRVRPGDARRLHARAREAGSVLVLVPPAGSAAARRPTPWPEAADLVLRTADPVWTGLEQGYGHLRSRQVEVVVDGRRRAARSCRARLWLPGADGEVALVEPVADPVPWTGSGARRPLGSPEEDHGADLEQVG